MKTKLKLIIAVLFCGALLSSCSKNGDNTTLEDIVAAANLTAEVGSPSITATQNALCLNLNPTISINVDSVVKLLLSGTTIQGDFFSLKITPDGPGKAKISLQVCTKSVTGSGGTGFLSNLFPSASAQTPKWRLIVDGKKDVNVFSTEAAQATTPSLTIIGNNICSSPYTGTQPIHFHVSGFTPNHWIAFEYPTNMTSMGELAEEGDYTHQTDNTGQCDIVFNNDVLAGYIIRQNLYGWSLPANTYAFRVRPQENLNYVFADVQITGASISQVITAAALKKKGRK